MSNRSFAFWTGALGGVILTIGVTATTLVWSRVTSTIKSGS